ncbi:MAG: NADH-quinone oxidoreductase subunit C [Deltaproteobacteria bacterium]|jgi:NADH-quinone oxidoreductase subunit C|nr:NADH-quinone oxidoreductase subunit C [Deltaproteobacteria bacterium]
MTSPTTTPAAISLDAWVSALGDMGASRVTTPDPKKTGLAVSAAIPPEKLAEAAEELKRGGFSLLFITAAEFVEGFLLTYVFDTFGEHFRLALRVLLRDKEKPEIPSLWSVFQGAEWHEREAFDFYGIVFDGNPNLVPLLLPSDFPGPPPLRKKPEALASLAKLDFFGPGVPVSPDRDFPPPPPAAPTPPAAPEGAES